MARAANVVDRAGARCAENMPERVDKIERVDVVANLLALVSEDCVRAARDAALDEICEEAVKLGAGVRGARQTAAAKYSRLHSEVLPVFLPQNIGCNLAGAKKRVFRLIDRHRLVDAV